MVMNLRIPSLPQEKEVIEEVIVGEGNEVEIAQARIEVGNDILMIVGIGVEYNIVSHNIVS